MHRLVFLVKVSTRSSTDLYLVHFIFGYGPLKICGNSPYEVLSEVVYWTLPSGFDYAFYSFVGVRTCILLVVMLGR